jgi:hypothetical protein
MMGNYLTLFFNGLEETGSFAQNLVSTGNNPGTGILNLLINLLITAAIIFVILQFIYARNSKRKDYYFSFFAVGITVFLLCYLLNNVRLELGFALGLFAIFGILRYRTGAIPIKEMTYLFVVIGVAVMNALANDGAGKIVLYTTNMIFVAFLWILEKWLCLESEQEIFLVYDNTDNIHGENNQQLIENLRARTGINIHRYKITKVDYLKDIVELTAYYYENDNNNLLPKDQNEQQHEKPSEDPVSSVLN